MPHLPAPQQRLDPADQTDPALWAPSAVQPARRQWLQRSGRGLATAGLAALALIGGLAALKRHLSNASAVQVATLPYDEKIIAYVQEWRGSGGRTALVTGSDRNFAEAIAAHLGIFDEVHGSDGKLNLKGDRKAKFLEDRFGFRGFAYMGDSKADLPVWQRAFSLPTPREGCGRGTPGQRVPVTSTSTRRSGCRQATSAGVRCWP